VTLDLPLTDSPRGVLLPVHVIPRAPRSRIDGVRRGALLVRLAAAPVEGAANDELLAVLAEALGVPRARLAIHSGERSRDKRILVGGLTAGELRGRLAKLFQDLA
jgi:uncharacterized protein (TIGR00251 family)